VGAGRHRNARTRPSPPEEVRVYICSRSVYSSLTPSAYLKARDGSLPGDNPDEDKGRGSLMAL